MKNTQEKIIGPSYVPSEELYGMSEGERIIMWADIVLATFVFGLILLVF